MTPWMTLAVLAALIQLQWVSRGLTLRQRLQSLGENGCKAQRVAG